MEAQDTIKPFPSTENLALSENESEFIYGGSIGINRILDMFRKRAPIGNNKTPAYPWHLYLLNGMTLFENVYEDKHTKNTIIELIEKDIEMLMIYASSYMSFFTKDRPTFIIYIPSYGLLPKSEVRSIPESKKKKWDMYEKVYRDIFQQNRMVQHQNEHGYQWVTKAGTQRLPHKELSRLIQSLPPKHYKKRTPIFLMSHIALDLHMSALVPNITLVERYTGLIKEPKNFGTKLNTNVSVPFNVYTHRLFGDKHLLHPLLKGKKKKTLEEKIATENWHLKTKTEIRNAILQHTEIASQQLDFIKL